MDTNRFNRDVDARRKIGEDLGVTNNDLVIGYAGAFSHIEGLPVLLQAFKNLSRKYSNIKLIILGGKVGGGLTHCGSSVEY